MKYQIFAPLFWKDIRFRKFKYEAKTQFLYLLSALIISLHRFFLCIDLLSALINLLHWSSLCIDQWSPFYIEHHFAVMLFMILFSKLLTVIFQYCFFLFFLDINLNLFMLFTLSACFAWIFYFNWFRFLNINEMLCPGFNFLFFV